MASNVKVDDAVVQENGLLAGGAVSTEAAAPCGRSTSGQSPGRTRTDENTVKCWKYLDECRTDAHAQGGAPCQTFSSPPCRA